MHAEDSDSMRCFIFSLDEWTIYIMNKILLRYCTVTLATLCLWLLLNTYRELDLNKPMGRTNDRHIYGIEKDSITDSHSHNDLTRKILISSNSKKDLKPSLVEDKILNPFNFTYLINNRHMCPKKEQLTYLIYIHTRPENFKKRESLRKTWAKNDVIPRYKSRVIFVIGDPRNVTIQKALRNESVWYGDIIQENYIDSYKNLTYKVMSAVKWIKNYCAGVKFIFKADDDAFVDIFLLMRLLHLNYWETKRFFMGQCFSGMPILRNPDVCMKWCVDNDTLPGRTTYPRYCSGGFMVISGDLVDEIYQQSLRIPFFWIDDVFLSGLVAQRLTKIEHINVGDLYMFDQVQYINQERDSGMASHFATMDHSNRLYEMWKGVLSKLPVEDKQLLGPRYYMRLLRDADVLFPGEVFYKPKPGIKAFVQNSLE